MDILKVTVNITHLRKILTPLLWEIENAVKLLIIIFYLFIFSHKTFLK